MATETQTSINNLLDSRILLDFESQRLVPNSPFSHLKELTKDQILIIKKNDNMKRRIDQILTLLSSSSTTPQLVLVSQSSNIQKLLSILEIVKSKLKSTDPLSIKNQQITLNQHNFIQYNRLDSIESSENPNYKPKHTNSGPIAPSINDDEPFTRDQLKELGILKDKTYKIPVFYVHLKLVLPSETPSGTPSPQLLSGWTLQSN